MPTFITTCACAHTHTHTMITYTSTHTYTHIIILYLSTSSSYKCGCCEIQFHFYWGQLDQAHTRRVERISQLYCHTQHNYWLQKKAVGWDDDSSLDTESCHYLRLTTRSRVRDHCKNFNSCWNIRCIILHNHCDIQMIHVKLLVLLNFNFQHQYRWKQK